MMYLEPDLCVVGQIRKVPLVNGSGKLMPKL